MTADRDIKSCPQRPVWQLFFSATFFKQHYVISSSSDKDNQKGGEALGNVAYYTV